MSGGNNKTYPNSPTHPTPQSCKTLPSWLGIEPVQTGIRRRLRHDGGFLGDEIHRNFVEAGGARLAVVGAAGTGKSTALANYVHSHRAQYTTVAFINAENDIVLTKSFQRVALGLGLDWATLLTQHGRAHTVARAILDQVCVCVCVCVQQGTQA